MQDWRQHVSLLNKTNTQSCIKSSEKNLSHWNAIGFEVVDQYDSASDSILWRGQMARS